MKSYQSKIIANLTKITQNENSKIDEAINLLIQAQLNKNSIFIFGASHAGIISQEVFYRAGGLININPIFANEVLVNNSPITLTSKMEQLEGYGTLVFNSSKIKSNDILILHSVSGRNPIIIDMALEARKNGIKIISITNLKYSKSVSSRHSCKKNLYELSDIVIDTHGEIGDAVCELPNNKQLVGPASTIASCFIMNTIISEVAIELCKINPDNVPVFYSANLDNTAEENKRLVSLYKDTIHYEF